MTRFSPDCCCSIYHQGAAALQTWLLEARRTSVPSSTLKIPEASRSMQRFELQGRGRCEALGRAAPPGVAVNPPALLPRRRSGLFRNRSYGSLPPLRTKVALVVPKSLLFAAAEECGL
jgi:hypothetical protein